MEEVDAIIRAVLSVVSIIVFAVSLLLLFRGVFGLIRAHGDLKKVFYQKKEIIRGIIGAIISAGCFLIVNVVLLV